MAYSPPSGRCQVRHIFALLAERGVFSERERITSISDALGLETRHGSPRCKRTWNDDQAKFLVLAMQLVYQRRLTPGTVLQLAQTNRLDKDPLAASLQALYSPLTVAGDLAVTADDFAA